MITKWKILLLISIASVVNWSYEIVYNCDNQAAYFREIIENEFNFCEMDSDCKVVYGMCPLGCFFIVNKNKEEEIEKIKAELSKKCEGTCVFNCDQGPSTLRCVNKVCYPGLDDHWGYHYIKKDCESGRNI